MKKANIFKGGKHVFKKMFFFTAVLSVLFAVLMVLPVFAEGENIIKNGDFEEVSGNLPSGWRFEAFDTKPGVTTYSVEGNAHSGSKCFVIENIKDNDVKLIQDVKVELGKVYKISFWIKAENFTPSNAAGGNLTIMNGIFESPQTKDTKGQWVKVEKYARVRSSGSDIMNVALRVGGFGTVTKGKAYFDDVSMVLVENPPAGAEVTNFYVPEENNNSNTAGSDKGSSGGMNKTLIIVIVIAVVVGLLVFVEIKFAKRGHNAGEDTDSIDEEDKDDSNEEEEEEESEDEDESSNNKEDKNYD